jgi:hypothetical protein
MISSKRRLLTGLVITCTSCVMSTGSASAATGPTVVVCGYESDFDASAHPADCFLDWPNLSLAEAVGLRKITWKGWGSPTATAHARTRVKTYDPWTYVRVRASGRQQCDGYRLYTRIRVTFPRGYRHTWSTPGCATMVPYGLAPDD